MAELFDEAADYVEVVRRLWDSWEDDAEIRDAATGRFIDRGKLHYIDFTGDYFSVKGPSITPRPPQGQPVVSALGHASVPYRLIARLGRRRLRHAARRRARPSIVAEIRDAQQAAGRAGDTVHVFGDLVVFLDEPGGETGAERKARLDELAGYPYASDAVDLHRDGRGAWPTCCRTGRRAGCPGSGCAPAPSRRTSRRSPGGWCPNCSGAARSGTPTRHATLRGLLGLGRPANRYATA